MSDPQKPGNARPATADSLHQRAAQLHRQGDLEAAHEAYAQILKAAPNDLGALHMSGIIAYQTARLEDAARLLARAATAHPGVAAVHIDRALVLQAFNRPRDAIASFDQALACVPNAAEVHAARGGLLQGLNRLAEALASYERAIALKPDNADVHSNRGVVLQALGRLEDALESYEKAATLQPNDSDILRNGALVLRALGRPAEALARLDRAAAIAPASGDLQADRGAILLDMRRLDEALASYDRAMSLKPRDADVLANRAAVLHALGRYAEALAAYDLAVEIDANHARAYSNRAGTLVELGRDREAKASLDRALAIEPDQPEANLNRALFHLRDGEFREGWRRYEWRDDKGRALMQRPGIPVWDGEDSLAGKTILLRAEQGFGDAIQFVRYAEMIAALGARVVLEVPAPLVRLLSGAAGVIEVLATGTALPPADFQSRLLSLPKLFATELNTIPAKPRYLAADAASRAKWSDMLAELPHPRIGLAWAGRPTHKNDRNRSISLDDFSTLLTADAAYVGLQPDVRAADKDQLAALPIRLFGEALSDFAETAALIENLDLVISVDTSVAHLAGALGKPVWVLLPFDPDWRWLLNRDDSPWYPSARLFRQKTPGDWGGVFSDVRAALQERLTSS